MNAFWSHTAHAEEFCPHVFLKNLRRIYLSSLTVGWNPAEKSRPQHFFDGRFLKMSLSCSSLLVCLGISCLYYSNLARGMCSENYLFLLDYQFCCHIIVMIFNVHCISEVPVLMSFHFHFILVFFLFLLLWACEFSLSFHRNSFSFFLPFLSILFISAVTVVVY